MSASVRLAGFLAVLVLAFGAAAVAGDALGPDPKAGGQAAHGDAAGEEAGHGDEAEHETEAAAHPVRGLAVAEGGLRLVVDDAEFSRGQRERLRFRIVEQDGSTVDDFDLEHERRMHLIVVRRDLSEFQHLHPEQGPDGSWTVPVRLAEAGSYRMFADFTRGATPYTLASDLSADGAADLQQLPPAATTADAGAAYEVRRNPGELSFTVYRDGEIVQVEPYLGAGGHLVALREGDLAFLHVHPLEHPGGESAETIAFEATFPTPGRYRLFLQFKHAGSVRTAAFTEEVR